MKNLVFILFLSLMTLSSYAQVKDIEFNTNDNLAFLRRAENFIGETEKVYKDFSSDNWNYSLGEFTKMNDEYREIDKNLTSDEKAEFSKLRGKYVGFAIKAGTDQVVETALKIIKNLTPFFEGLKESVMSSFGSDSLSEDFSIE